jgi:hypothetical protein
MQVPEFSCGGVVIRLDAGLSEPLLLYRLVRLVQVPHTIALCSDRGVERGGEKGGERRGVDRGVDRAGPSGAADLADVFLSSIVMRVAVTVAMSSTPSTSSTRGRKHCVGRRALRVSGSLFEGILGFLGGGGAIQIPTPRLRVRRRASTAKSTGHNELLV